MLSVILVKCYQKIFWQHLNLILIWYELLTSFVWPFYIMQIAFTHLITFLNCFQNGLFKSCSYRPCHSNSPKIHCTIFHDNKNFSLMKLNETFLNRISTTSYWYRNTLLHTTCNMNPVYFFPSKNNYFHCLLEEQLFDEM